MISDCGCIERFRSMLEDRRRNAGRMLEVDLPRRLEAFAEAMRLGAIQLVARQLLRAGVYRSSLDLNGSRDVSIEDAIKTLNRIAALRPRLLEFLQRHLTIVYEQAVYVNPEEVLPKKIKSHEHLSEVFGGHIDRALDVAEKMLDQLETLEKRLPLWKSYVRGADVPRVDPIMDYHDSLR
ncbi:MAG: hypothetical protein N2260_00890 [Syntrophobacterales bacterium]|nr:hypothetical protein [Syntrophobacterales bacterium]